MSKLIARLASVLALAIVSSFLSVSVAYADEGESTQTQRGGQAMERGFRWDVDGLTQGVIERYDKFVTRTESGFVARIPDSLERSHSAEVAAVEKAVEKANRHRQQADGSASDGVGTQAGHGGFDSHWWGVTVWVDGWAAGHLQDAIYAGAGIAGLAAIITSVTGVGGVTAGAIAAALTAAGGVVGLCNWYGDGVDFHRAWSGQVWCTPRG